MNENGTFRKRFPEGNVLETLFSRARVDRRTELFENAEDTLSVPIHSAQY